MDRVRDVCSAALSLRKTQNLRVRLPLASLTVAASGAPALRNFADLIADEVNVKSVELTEDVSAHCEQVLTVVPRTLGPRVGAAVQQVIKAVKAGDWTMADGSPVAAGVTLAEGEYELRLVARAGSSAAPIDGGVVLLDTALTAELVAEGIARDVVRVVQQARREAGLDVSDRISLTVSASDEVLAAIRAHQEFVAGEVLASSVTFGAVPAGFSEEVGDGDRVTVLVSRA